MGIALSPTGGVPFIDIPDTSKKKTTLYGYGRSREDLTYNRSGARLKSVKIGRNDPCPCGSGKKYKKCCINK